MYKNSVLCNQGLYRQEYTQILKRKVDFLKVSVIASSNYFPPIWEETVV